MLKRRIRTKVTDTPINFSLPHKIDNAINQFMLNEFDPKDFTTKTDYLFELKLKFMAYYFFWRLELSSMAKFTKSKIVETTQERMSVEKLPSEGHFTQTRTRFANRQLEWPFRPIHHDEFQNFFQKDYQEFKDVLIFKLGIVQTTNRFKIKNKGGIGGESIRYRINPEFLIPETSIDTLFEGSTLQMVDIKVWPEQLANSITKGFAKNRLRAEKHNAETLQQLASPNFKIDVDKLLIAIRSSLAQKREQWDLLNLQIAQTLEPKQQQKLIKKRDKIKKQMQREKNWFRNIQADQSHLFKYQQKQNGRAFAHFTSIKQIYREYIYHTSNQPIYEFDFRCFQPWITGQLLNDNFRKLFPGIIPREQEWLQKLKENNDVSKYQSMTQRGTLYSYLSDISGIPVTQVKEQLLKAWSAPKMPKYPGSIWAHFHKEFPSIWKLLKLSKAGGHRKFNHMLTKIEGTLMIQYFGEELWNNEFEFKTVFDSFYFVGDPHLFIYTIEEVITRTGLNTLQFRLNQNGQQIDF